MLQALLTGLEVIIQQTKQNLNCSSFGADASLMALILAIVGKIPSIIK